MYLSTNEVILTTLFNCGVADLDMLEDCFKGLAEDACNPTGILEELRDNGELSLNRFLSLFISAFSCKICPLTSNLIALFPLDI